MAQPLSFSPASIAAVEKNIMKPQQIRNVGLFGSTGSGKTCLADSLISLAGVMPSGATAGEARAMHSRADEAQKGMTMRAGVASLPVHWSELAKRHCGACDGGDGNDTFVMNLVDTPGHGDFASEVTPSIRICDGAVVVVDCLEGVAARSESLLRQCVAERVKPIIVFNKFDKLIDTHVPGEQIYETFRSQLRTVNTLLASISDKVLGDSQVHPVKGEVVFTSATQGWGFTLTQFGKIYSDILGIQQEALTQRLWGDNFFDPESLGWQQTSKSAGGKDLHNGFVSFIVEPIRALFLSAMENSSSRVHGMLEANGGAGCLTQEDMLLTGADLAKRALSRWLPLGVALSSAVIKRLPSPVVAQPYRALELYPGCTDVNDGVVDSFRSCDSEGPVVAFVVRMIPSNSDPSKFLCLARVFSGTITAGMNVKVMEPQTGNVVDTGPSRAVNVATGREISRVMVPLGATQQVIAEGTAGSIVYISGIDAYIAKSATVTELDSDVLAMRTLRFPTVPCVRTTVECKNPEELPKLVEGMRRLSKSDPFVQCIIEESGMHAMAGGGELHIELLLRDLQERYIFDLQSGLYISDVAVCFMETVTAPSSEMCLAKSSNGKNSVLTKAFPMEEALTQAIEVGKIALDHDDKARARLMAKRFGWDLHQARRIWAFGPGVHGPNLLVECLADEKRTHVVGTARGPFTAAFQHVTGVGVLADEELRGVRFNVQDIILHHDAALRGDGQLLGMARRSMQGAQLCAQPRLVEPVSLVVVTCTDRAAPNLKDAIGRRRGTVFSERHRAGTALYEIIAHMPTSESFGFVPEVKRHVGSKGGVETSFDHWEICAGDPTIPGRAQSLVAELRKRRGLCNGLPELEFMLQRGGDSFGQVASPT